MKVLIVDDHPIWRGAVERDLAGAGFEVVAAVGDGETAVRIAPAVRPEVALMDLQLPGLSGVETTAQLVRADPELRVLMLSSSGEDDDVLAAVKAGARGYLVKSASPSELIDAVRRTGAGEAVYSPGLAALVLGEYRRLQGEHRANDQPGRQRYNAELTDREAEVLRLVAKGLTARQIAERLELSYRTVQNHVQNTLRKLQLHNKVELTRWAIDQGLSD
jgi:DNA-binding NarL/FixJ family response regulator